MEDMKVVGVTEAVAEDRVNINESKWKEEYPRETVEETDVTARRKWLKEN